MAIGARESKHRLDTAKAKPLKEVHVFGPSIPPGVVNVIQRLRKAVAAERPDQSSNGAVDALPAGPARRRLEEFLRRID